jgi:glycosyltransferase involved in cell wall biosynthesis
MTAKPLTIGVNALFYIPGEVGGTETYLRATLIAMAEQAGTDRLVVFTNLENHETLKADLAAFPGVTLVSLKFRAMNRMVRILREQIELPWRVRASGVEVLWSPGYTAPVLATCPQVVSILDMQYKAFPHDLTFIARLATDILVKAAARRAKRILAISEFSRGEIVKYTSAEAGKIEVVHLAASPAFGVPLTEETRTQFLRRLIPSPRPYLLCVAATYPHKNVQALIRAFGQLMPAIPHNLVLVGNARLGEPEVAKALAALPEPARVIRLKRLAELELVALYQGCDVFVFPSLYEGFGLPVLEGLMAGVPVVTTRCASIPEVGGDVAEYFDPGDPLALPAAIESVLGWSPAERQARVQRGRAFARSFSWSTSAARTLTILRGAMVAKGERRVH